MHVTAVSGAIVTDGYQTGTNPEGSVLVTESRAGTRVFSSPVSGTGTLSHTRPLPVHAAGVSFSSLRLKMVYNFI